MEEPKRANLKIKIALLVITSPMWIVILAAAAIFVFSIYPNYILNGRYGPVFAGIKGWTDKELGRVVAFKEKLHSSPKSEAPANPEEITVLSANDHRDPPPVVSHYLMLTIDLTPEQKAALYYKGTEPPGKVLYHPVMVPDPFATYAPAAGDINGVVFHNSQQFRYPKDLEKKKPKEFRVFITGGSVAWGAMASSIDYTIAGYLEKKLRQKFPGKEIKVVTAGAGGWTTTQEREWILNRITEFEPDVILTYSGFNDIQDVCLTHENMFNRSWVDGQYFRMAMKRYDEYNRGSVVASLIDMNNETSPSFDCVNMTVKNLEIATSYLNLMKVPFVYVLQPFGKKFQAQERFKTMIEKYRQAVLKTARERHFAFFDHSNFFTDHENLFIDGCHVGSIGNDMIAEDLARKIDWNQLINSPSRKN